VAISQKFFREGDTPIAKPGEGGGLEQVGFHGLEPEHLVAAVKELVR
jgi:hypothetical protein